MQTSRVFCIFQDARSACDPRFVRIAAPVLKQIQKNGKTRYFRGYDFPITI